MAASDDHPRENSVRRPAPPHLAPRAAKKAAPKASVEPVKGAKPVR